MIKNLIMAVIAATLIAVAAFVVIQSVADKEAPVAEQAAPAKEAK